MHVYINHHYEYVKKILCTQNFVKMTDIEWLANLFVKSIKLHGIQFILAEYLSGLMISISFLFVYYIFFFDLLNYCNSQLLRRKFVVV